MENYSVLMPLWYREKLEYLEVALKSMLQQTIKPNEIVLIKDHPISDDMQRLLQGISEKTNIEINVYENYDLNGRGLSSVLAYGVLKCKNSLVARMDSDDISYKDRCEAELHEFANNHNLSLLGGWADEFIIDPTKIETVHIVPSDIIGIKRRMKYTNPFNHPTVMFRREVVINCGNYNANVRKNEDYELWYRIISKGYICKNLSRSLLLFRRGNSFICRRKNKEQHDGKLAIKRQMYKDGFMNLREYICSIAIEQIYYYLPLDIRKIAFRLLGSSFFF